MKLQKNLPAKQSVNMVKVGEKGQIVIPKDVREMFGITPGDSLVLLADSNQGISLSSQEILQDLSNSVFNITDSEREEK